MKKILTLIALASPFFPGAQNVGIGTSSPASKLTINGNNPDIGLMNNGLAHGFIKATGQDLQIGTAPDNPTGKLILGTKDNDHFNIDHLGRVSVGTSSSFDAEMKLNGTSFTRFAFLQGDVQKSYFYLNGAGDFRIGTYAGNSGRILFSPKGADKVCINENGLVGIGTLSPVAILTINANDPVLQFQDGGVNKGMLQSFGNDIRIGTNAANTTGNLVLQTKQLDRILVDENGRVGIGTSAPASVLAINDTDPIIQLRNGETDKGFLQLVGSDMKLGMNAANIYGRLIFRNNGVDRMVVNYNGSVGIGTMFPYQTLGLNSSTPSLGLNVNEVLYGSLTVDNASKDFIIEKSTSGSGKMFINATGGNGWGIHLTEDGHFHYGSGLNPAGYTFSSQGRILAPDFVALAVNNWPDYVFSQDYRLLPLDEVKKHIERYHHLPNIPSAAQLEKDGVPLADMSKRLMEKVEELTLYILQQQEQIDELKKQVEAPAKKE